MSSEAVVPYFVGKLGDYLIQKAQLLFGVRKEVEWIKNELEWMQCFLKDADSKINRDARVKKWVSDIIDVSYESEDLIETFIIDSERRRQGLLGALKKLKSFVWEDDVAKQIEQIKKRITDIKERRETYGIGDINEGSQEASSWIRDLEGRRRHSVMFDEAPLVGQHEEFRTVRDQLMNEEERRRVISIFGIGGSGLFPEDYEISSGKLIRLWIAEGFIQQKGNRLMEDVAEDYLEELVSRSMIQIASKKSNGSIHKCCIHDLLHELSISEARENSFFAVHNDNDTSSSSTSVRRLAIHRNIDWDETKNNSMESLRSILCFFYSNVDGIKLPNTSSKFLKSDEC